MLRKVPFSKGKAALRLTVTTASFGRGTGIARKEIHFGKRIVQIFSRLGIQLELWLGFLVASGFGPGHWFFAPSSGLVLFVPIPKIGKGFGKAFVGGCWFLFAAWRSSGSRCKVGHFELLFFSTKVRKTHVAALGKPGASRSGLAVASCSRTRGNGIGCLAGSIHTRGFDVMIAIAVAVSRSIEIGVAGNGATAGTTGFLYWSWSWSWNGRAFFFLLVVRKLLQFLFNGDRGRTGRRRCGRRRLGGGVHDEVAIRRLGGAALAPFGATLAGLLASQFAGIQHEIKGRTGLTHVSLGTVLLGSAFVGCRVEVKVGHAHGERLVCGGRHVGCVVLVVNCVRFGLLIFSSWELG